MTGEMRGGGRGFDASGLGIGLIVECDLIPTCERAKKGSFN
jgi:hypothetical protein